MIENAAKLMILSGQRIDITGDVNMSDKGLSKLLDEYGHISGSFIVSNNDLTTLINGPTSVGADYYVGQNPLRNLTGCPSIVPKDFNCANTEIANYIGGPTSVGGNYHGGNNSMVTSFEGLPLHIGTSGSGNLNLSYTNLASLAGINKYVKTIAGYLDLTKTPVKAGGLGLLMIRGITEVKSNYPAFRIINQFIHAGPAGIGPCRRQLIAEGLEAFAKL